jgi:caffeoyl-CoA O-methyltransferase
MSEKFTEMSPELHRYAVEHSHVDEVLERLGEETAALGDVAVMQMAPEQGALTTLLVRALDAGRALEVGTFTGYGSISIARGLRPGGTLLTCDVSEEWTEIARRHWREAGLEDRIDLRIGPALETLHELDPGEPFDFAFIDADKESYPAYYEECVRLVRPGGVIALDNVFMGGGVIDPEAGRPGVVAMREVNDRIASDNRVHAAMIGVADGVTLALKR